MGRLFGSNQLKWPIEGTAYISACLSMQDMLPGQPVGRTVGTTGDWPSEDLVVSPETVSSQLCDLHQTIHPLYWTSVPLSELWGRRKSGSLRNFPKLEFNNLKSMPKGILWFRFPNLPIVSHSHPWDHLPEMSETQQCLPCSWPRKLTSSLINWHLWI